MRARTHEHHGHALRHHERDVQVPDLARAQRVHPRVLCLALAAAVPAEVVVGAVAVALACACGKGMRLFSGAKWIKLKFSFEPSRLVQK
jgi:hypothetical protein